MVDVDPGLKGDTAQGTTILLVLKDFFECFINDLLLDEVIRIQVG